MENDNNVMVLTVGDVQFQFTDNKLIDDATIVKRCTVSETERDRKQGIFKSVLVNVMYKAGTSFDTIIGASVAKYIIAAQRTLRAKYNNVRDGDTITYTVGERTKKSPARGLMVKILLGEITIDDVPDEHQDEVKGLLKKALANIQQ